MNRTIKDATVKRYHYDDHHQLRTHLNDFISAYNFARRLKTLKGLTPYEYICKIWTNEPETIQARSTPSNAGTKQQVLSTFPAPAGAKNQAGIPPNEFRDEVERRTAMLHAVEVTLAYGNFYNGFKFPDSDYRVEFKGRLCTKSVFGLP